MTRIREPDLETPLASNAGNTGYEGATGTLHRMADCIRALAMDAIAAARSGHTTLPLGMADAATGLFTQAMRYDASDPRWPDRDRFVLSAGHGSALLYAILHLTGHAGMDADALRGFRQLHSPAAGHPEHGEHPAIEATTGPLGQGLGIAVGMALAERLLAARFGRSLVDHRTWVLASDGDLMEGISHESAALAGHLQLERLTVLWDDNGASLDGDVALTCSVDHLRRFASYGWATRRVDGRDPAQLASALAAAARSRKPTLIACRSTAPRTLDDSRGTLNWPLPPFTVPPELAQAWLDAGAQGGTARRGWKKRLARHALRAEFERMVAGRLPDTWHTVLAALKPAMAEAGMATREASHRVLDALAPAIPELVGGSADCTGSSQTQARGMAHIAPGRFSGRYVHYGVREHGMAACVNGLALHGGVLPYAGTYLAFSDYMRPALRLAALMRQRVIHVLTHDSIGLGEDGPTHQPVEQLASLRSMPGVHVLRPADSTETAECWEIALRRADGPSMMVLSRQCLPPLRTDWAENRCARGGYVLAEADGPRQATIVASGSEVSVALAARSALALDGIQVAVVSLPCWELFALQSAETVAAVLGTAPRLGIEAGCGFGWERWLGADGIFIGMTGYGASAPADALYRHFGITAEAAVAALRKRLGREAST